MDAPNQRLTDKAVFVYGTLKPGGRYWPQFCEGRVWQHFPAKIHGELYDLGVGYPGLLRRGDSWVQGVILELKTEADLRRIDWLEGYEPGRREADNEYNRLRVPCYDHEGSPLGTAWAYELTAASFRRYRAVRLKDGVWPVGD